ncbi:RNA-binding protein MEX3B-like [Rhincodon typus]|uniref:RNA-binding protein MEX3B-like n=1 Tax=Rhincodon typus TaxID=259920 RepID=UPI00202DEADE|nr:RNA-binding protein MEX3B-like [Rhincodon typus]
MPSSELLMEQSGTLELVVEMEMGLGMGRMLEDEQRALQLALDQLSMLGLSEEQEQAELLADGEEEENVNNNNNNTSAGSGHHRHQHHRESYLAALYEGGEAKRKSCNTTECVPVPSSEHVAEIVGRQGCKIKALRAKTNTYIKTPVRGEEPVFVVTGRREDVAMARREIISAAEHFSLIRASRNKDGPAPGAVPVPPNLPGQTTIQVRVPYRVVGLVVGPKGATIKRIQQQTHTYIVTPSRDKEPVFEVTGMPANVDRAREEIEAHIAVRTGGLVELNDENDFHCNGVEAGYGGRAPKPWPKLALPAGRKPLASFRGNGPDPFYGNAKPADLHHHQHHACYGNGAAYGEAYFGAEGREGPPDAHRWPPAAAAPPPPPPPRHAASRECQVCFESEVTAALVPCGHNLFCMECANRICQRSNPHCPACLSTVTQAIPGKQLALCYLSHRCPTDGTSYWHADQTIFQNSEPLLTSLPFSFRSMVDVQADAVMRYCVLSKSDG